jgi:predicted MPP superfamily phosphohydrolase
MRIPTRLIFIFCIVFLFIGGLGVYISTGIAAAVRGMNGSGARIVLMLFWSEQLLLFAGLGFLLWNMLVRRKRNERMVKIIGTTLVICLVPLLVFAAFLLLEDGYRLLAGTIQWIIPNDHKWVFPPRSALYNRLVAIPVIALLFGIFYGVTRGKYRYKVHRVALTFPNLPEAFDGLTITQLSDIHAGSFDNPEKVRQAIELVNAQQSDLLFFTGDLVNNKASEMTPWISIFNQTTAKLGKFSILGNHDYGDYVNWPSQSHKDANLEQLCAVHEQIGFNLLKNESVKIKRDGSFIELLGVENWGSGSFAKYGNLDKTLEGTSAESFKILLSHDPSHWKEQVVKHEDAIQLTLSGHTHGMQFGFEYKKLRFSPVQFRYKEWAGLYQENERFLYVNRGFGFLGFPGRVGIWPEITVFTLRRK